MQKPKIVGNTIVIPSDHQFLSDVDMFVEGLLRGWNADESFIADVAISVSELVNNAITHGNKLSVDLSVTVKVVKSGDEVSIEVSDQGRGFNPDGIANPISDENLLKDVGRGIFIVRSLMDKVDVNPSSRGTRVTITKKLS
ncbi:MAG TPA: ATP-binding protein [candidate division Zixibacteria bacterium]|nr:ATP-binding protein [candidate division Zixibacteria bacterium]